MTALLKRLSQTTPPVMPETVARLQALRTSQVSRHADVGQVLMEDPAATVAVFRELERMRPGSFEQVADTAHAVSLLGASRFQQLVDGLPLATTDTDGRGGLAAALARGAHAAHFAIALGRHRGLTADAELATAALLQDPVWLALWASAPEQAAQVTAAVRAGAPLHDALQEALKEPLVDLNGMLARTWGMPTLARQAIKPVPGDTRPKLAAVQLADTIATATSAGWQHPMLDDLPGRLGEYLSLDADGATCWLHEQATEIARELSGYAYPLAGYDLLLLPSEVEETPDPPAAPAPPGTRQTVPTPAPRKAPPPKTAQAPATKSPKAPPGKSGGRPDLHDTMVDIMRRIRSETGASRVLFAMLSADRRQLRTRMVLGGQRDDALRQLSLDVDGRHLFGALMKKSQSVWLNKGNAARYAPLLSNDLRETIQPDNAFVMSLFVRNRALGLLYSDGEALDDVGYQRFRALCNKVTNALSS